MVANSEKADVEFPPAADDMLQVVDYEENFNDALESFLDSQNIISRGFDYHVASILGAQSSGKSTLLNLLFGTQFCTMDESSGRYQVTQGVWMGISTASPILVFDLEGTDSRERGESAANFERKIALFALALSEVLIVNIWAQDVGRFNAANMELLKTVMELDLQLFFGGDEGADSSKGLNEFAKRMHKTRLLFVIRDHVSSPFELLCRTLRDDVEKIWDQISKPEAASGIPLDSFFDLDFFSLPHKVLMEQQFFQRGGELRRQFEDGEVFLDEYASGIAADGFPTYARSVWNTIRDNRELDIPTQKEMLAHVRCEQLARDALAALEKTIDRFRDHLFPADGGAPTLAEGAVEAVIPAAEIAFNGYDAAADRYSKRIAEEKRADLNTRISTAGRGLFDAAVSAASAAAIDILQKKLTEHLTTQAKMPWKSWSAFSSRVQELAVSKFINAAGIDAINALDDDHVLSGLRTSATAAQRRLEAHVSERLEEAEAKMQSRGTMFIVDNFATGLKPPVSSAIDSAGAGNGDVWRKVSDAADVSWEEAQSVAKGMFGSDGIGLPPETVDNIVKSELKPACYDVVVKTVRDVAGSSDAVLMRMTRRFDDEFRFDERGVPRHFGPSEDVDSLFVSARESAEAVVDALLTMRLSGTFGPAYDGNKESNEVDESEELRAMGREVEVINPAMASELREKLRRQAGAIFLETKRSQEAAKVTSKIPLWIVGLVLLLGWNEFVAVLRNPALLMLTIIILPAAYVAYALDMRTVVGPAVTAAVGPIVEQAKQTVRQYVAEDEPVPAHAVPGASNLNPSTSGNSSISNSTTVSESMIFPDRSDRSTVISDESGGTGRMDNYESTANGLMTGNRDNGVKRPKSD